MVFGWRKCGDAWSPTAHTTLPLVNAQLPTTVKQLRSWLGSYKQLASCIQNYAIPLKRLEMLTGSDKSSASKIEWTDQLINEPISRQAILINKGLVYRRSIDLESKKNYGIWLEIKLKGQKSILICGGYRQ